MSDEPTLQDVLNRIDELDTSLGGRIDELDTRLGGRIDELTKEMETHGRWVREELGYVRNGLPKDIANGLVDVLQERGLIKGAEARR